MLEKFGLVKTKAQSVKVGDLFGRLKVIATGQIPNTYRYYAICKCECGSDLFKVRFDGLTSGFTLSCGCYQLEKSTKHGKRKSIHYDRWYNMIDRCENTLCKSYPQYGGRGITVCDEWYDINQFIKDLPEGYFEGAEIDRIDNEKGYYPGNVRWATRSENSDNRTTGTRVEYNGQVKSVKRWSEEYGINYTVLHDRLYRYGWSVEDALTTPSLSAKERMKRALDKRWEGHIKKPEKPKQKVNKFEYCGKLYTIKELSEMTGLTTNLLRKRICERKWDVQRAVETVKD